MSAQNVISTYILDICNSKKAMEFSISRIVYTYFKDTHIIRKYHEDVLRDLSS